MSVELPSINLVMDVFDYESIIVADTAKGLTSDKYAPTNGRVATRVVITVESASMRYRSDGSDPTSSEGHMITPRSSLVVVGPQAIKDLRFIRTGSVSGKLRVSYGR